MKSRVTNQWSRWKRATWTLARSVRERARTNQQLPRARCNPPRSRLVDGKHTLRQSQPFARFAANRLVRSGFKSDIATLGPAAEPLILTFSPREKGLPLPFWERVGVRETSFETASRACHALHGRRERQGALNGRACSSPHRWTGTLSSRIAQTMRDLAQAGVISALRDAAARRKRADSAGDGERLANVLFPRVRSLGVCAPRDDPPCPRRFSRRVYPSRSHRRKCMTRS